MALGGEEKFLRVGDPIGFDWKIIWNLRELVIFSIYKKKPRYVMKFCNKIVSSWKFSIFIQLFPFQKLVKNNPILLRGIFSNLCRLEINT